MNKSGKSKILIVNADDFGQSAGINQGIIKCYEYGIVSSTSFMTRYKTSADAADYAKSHPGLDVGLHLDFGEWRLINGEWKPVYEVVPLGDEELIKLEIDLQIETFVKLIGKYPSHIDSHQHTHLKKNVLPLVVNFASQLNSPIRHCNSQIRYCGYYYGQNEKGISTPDLISTIALKKILLQLDYGVTELACHPAAFIDIETMYTTERIMELETLCDTSIKEILNTGNIQVSTFNAIVML